MKLGELNTKIDFCIKNINNGPVDDLENTYSTIINGVWAKKIKLLGKENIKFGIEHNTVQVNFIIRTRSDISEDMYIQHENITYNIIGYEELQNYSNYMLIATVKNR